MRVMKREVKPLHQIVDTFFESKTSQSYIKPEIPEELANEVDDWYLVNIPGAIAIFRRSGFVNLDEGYAGEPPVLMIHRRFSGGACLLRKK